MRFTLCMMLLVVCVFAWECTAESAKVSVSANMVSPANIIVEGLYAAYFAKTKKCSSAGTHKVGEKDSDCAGAGGNSHSPASSSSSSFSVLPKPSASAGSQSSPLLTDNNGNGLTTVPTKEQRKDQSQISHSQSPVDGSSSTSSSNKQTPDQQTGEEKVTESDTPHGKPLNDRTTSEYVQKTNDKAIKQPVTENKGNAGAPKDTKSGTGVTTNNDIRNTPNTQPVPASGTGNTLDSTTTTEMAELVDPKDDNKDTLTEQKVPLNKLGKAAQQLKYLEKKNDGISSTFLLPAFATLVTFSVMAVLPVY